MFAVTDTPGSIFLDKFYEDPLGFETENYAPPDVRIELICFEFLWLIKEEKSGEFTIESPPSTKI